MSAESTSVVGEAYFTIEGAFIVDFARRLFMEGKPGKAWRMLRNSLLGGAGRNRDRLAMDILDGKKTLVGDSNVGIDDADETPGEALDAYLKQTRWMYAGRVRVDGAWWRPRAIVVERGPDDAAFASDVLDGEIPTGFGPNGAITAFERERIRFYARDGERVFDCGRMSASGLGVVLDHEYVIFEACGEPPFWWDENVDPVKAVADFFAANRRLEEERWSHYFKARPERTRKRKSRAATPPPTPEERAEREAADEAKAIEAEAALKKRCEEIGAQVRARAGEDVFALAYVEDGAQKTLRVARAPFVNWALSRTALRDLAPEWAPISPVSMKMPLDDAHHTDWILGAGLELRYDYNRTPWQAAANEEMFRLQEKYGKFECTVLVGGSDIVGAVGTDIVILPNLHPDFLPKIAKARAVIAEAGGALAHLAQIARERALPVLLVKDAVARFGKAKFLHVEPSKGRVRVFHRPPEGLGPSGE